MDDAEVLAVAVSSTISSSLLSIEWAGTVASVGGVVDV
jgi:hypothetical protein